MPHAGELVAVERARLGEPAQAVGQLDLAALAALGALDLVEDVGRQQVTTDDREVARGILRLSTMFFTR